MAKQLGEKDLNNVSRQQMRSRAEDYLLGQAADTLQQQAQELLSPLGTARLSLKMTGEGDFTGSNGQLFSPLYDVDVTDSAAALGFISAIGAAGGFFIPQAFGTSLAMTGSPAGAMKVFLVFYILCVVITWAVYGRKKKA
ncbi:inverse autotransporter beta domain-containing protein [Serratia marcescens]|nr:inverse autotransporter beta domain-containing protein [Serratia marcescens]MDP8680384.1 inverse autotransporter beta domain-containing protein [Serratia marcescens]